MAVVFLLGPSIWEVSNKGSPAFSPMQVRREIAMALREGGHKVILMEDDPERPGEDLISKFDRLLRQGVTDIVVYWPPAAKMQTTYDELILLCDRHEFLKREAILVWVLHHASVASIQKDEFKIKELGNRSRYLTAIVRLGVQPLEWANETDLAERVRLLSTELRR